jgi:hypothetical protein
VGPGSPRTRYLHHFSRERFMCGCVYMCMHIRKYKYIYYIIIYDIHDPSSVGRGVQSAAAARRPVSVFTDNPSFNAEQMR